MTFEVRNLGSFEEADGGNCGNSFFGTKGFYVVGKGLGFFTYKEGKMSERQSIPIPADAEKPEKGSKFERFFTAVRSRKPADLTVSTADAHGSCVHCHLGNLLIAGRSLEFDPKTERFKDAEANKYLKREYRHGFECRSWREPNLKAEQSPRMESRLQPVGLTHCREIATFHNRQNCDHPTG